ncbi:MAG: tRNA (guanosine(37)-N1)-methyltransferase TrmD [Bacteroidota bacterium]|nr:tRNA (guanosine(37)-N1)-methyltransferase TrmD [Bacteroidota bacterium]
MRIDIITVVPELFHSPFNHSMVKRAQDKGLVEINIINLRDYSLNKYGQVDDYQYGGGAGMVLMCEPLSNAIEDLIKQRTYQEIIYTSPDGDLWNQHEANKLSTIENIIIICGHYKGIDQRIRDLYVTKEISIGDFVLTGGEMAAVIISDSIVRLLPGVLGNEESALTDSFQDDLLAPPVYTRPAEFKGLKVPEVLLSGNFKLIDEWRMDQSELRTKEKRPQLYKK